MGTHDACRDRSAPGPLPPRERHGEGGACVPSLYDGERALWAEVLKQSVAMLRMPSLAKTVANHGGNRRLTKERKRSMEADVPAYEAAWWSPGGGAQVVCELCGWDYQWLRRKLEAEGLLSGEVASAAVR